MNYTIKSKKLSELVEKANCITDTNNILPGYRSICLEFKGNDVIATSSNGRTLCRCKDTIESGDGDCTIHLSRRKLLSIIKTFKDDIVKIAVDGNNVEFSDNSSTISIVGFSEAEATVDNEQLLFSSIGDSGSIIVNCGILTKTIANSFSSHDSANDIHIIKGNINLRIHDKIMSVSSTNGKFIFSSDIEYSADAKSPIMEQRYFIPYNCSAKGLLAFLKQISSDKIRIVFNENSIVFIVKDAYYSCTFNKDEDKWKEPDVEKP